MQFLTFVLKTKQNKGKLCAQRGGTLYWQKLVVEGQRLGGWETFFMCSFELLELEGFFN